MKNYVNLMIEHHPALEVCRKDVESAVDAVLTMHKNGGKLLLCGNGGSAADCEHIAGELLKGFLLRRTPEGDLHGRLAETMGAENAEKLQRGVSAVPLPSLVGVGSAFCNDVDPALVYAQLVLAMGRPEDVLLCISTSGNSKNVVYAAKAAKALGIRTVALTGGTGGQLRDLCDIVICVPETETYRIQEYHLPVYHALCAQVEEVLFGKV
ncbi:MAG: SIS domain-containing protein [Clostridia bacterium]|nr:SIS domain-containing protein [Clostridia bacterium]